MTLSFSFLTILPVNVSPFFNLISSAFSGNDNKPKPTIKPTVDSNRNSIFIATPIIFPLNKQARNDEAGYHQGELIKKKKQSMPTTSMIEVDNSRKLSFLNYSGKGQILNGYAKLIGNNQNKYQLNIMSKRRKNRKPALAEAGPTIARKRQSA